MATYISSCQVSAWRLPPRTRSMFPVTMMKWPLRSAPGVTFLSDGGVFISVSVIAQSEKLLQLLPSFSFLASCFMDSHLLLSLCPLYLSFHRAYLLIYICKLPNWRAALDECHFLFILLRCLGCLLSGPWPWWMEHIQEVSLTHCCPSVCRLLPL